MYYLRMYTVYVYTPDTHTQASIHTYIEKLDFFVTYAHDNCETQTPNIT